MALARTDLTAVTQIGMASTVAVVTVGGGQTCYVKSIMLHNLNESADQNCNIYVVPNSGGSAGTIGTANRIARVGVGSDDTFFFEPAYPIVLTKTGDTLQVGNEGITADSINVYVTGDIDLQEVQIMGVKSTQFRTRGGFEGEDVSGKSGQSWHTQQVTDINVDYGSPRGHTATGGVINDWTDSSSGNVYRSHIFNSSGSFDVTTLSSTYPAVVDYMVVGGGGGTGTRWHTGGAGAGGLLVSPGFPGVPTTQNQGSTVTLSTSPGSYTITVGAGGRGIGSDNNTNTGATNGGSSAFGPITVDGGGVGATYATDGIDGGSGGGGGGGGGGMPGGSATNYPGPTQQGFPGADGHNPSPSGIGGGGGGAGGTGSGPAPGGSPSDDGGVGLQVLIAGPATDITTGAPGPGGARGWYAGGGGVGFYPANSNAQGQGGGPGGPYAGGGPGGASGARGGDGWANTGGGGGGPSEPSDSQGSQGGSGVVVVRYQIGRIQTALKATGGAVNFYNGKVIHTFLNSGTFTNVSGAPLEVDHIIMAGGGGGGGKYHGGGGGAGGVRTSFSIPGLGDAPAADNKITVGTGAPNAQTVTVGAGGISGPGTPGSPDSPGIKGGTGGDSAFGPYTANGGGGGGSWSGTGGANGGSGGGGGTGPTGSPGGGGNTNAPAQGYGGGVGAGGAWQGAGGGGGAKGAGSNSPSHPGDKPAGGSGSVGGAGGVGWQIPSDFHDPKAVMFGAGPGPSYYWIGGGGGGSTASSGTPGKGGGAPPSIGTWAGGGAGSWNPDTGAEGGLGMNGLDGTGGGGGGSERDYPSDINHGGGKGGSGVVLILYPQ